ncbi:hypothetical protein BKA24_001698 [Microbacterium marinum]|uniref:Uncharacterized protein n=1 Tax=Microbacterium marinum TaxID=421115 RepID=A0A7W7BQJ2_9MICO|nr:hypothetical protein [Microbacterium marinum]MBB4666989.1 hypothetical protein [Microbacterium marinum]
MARVTFAFADPRPDGADAPTGSRVRCALLQPDSSADVIRSTAAFDVDLYDGAGEATLASGVWRITVEGVSGVDERFVIVPAGDDEYAFRSLVDVDPATLAPSPEAVAVWQDLYSRLAAGGGEIGGGRQSVDYSFPGDLVPRIGTPWRSPSALCRLTKLTVDGVIYEPGGLALRLTVNGGVVAEMDTRAAADRSIPLAVTIGNGARVAVDIVEVFPNPAISLEPAYPPRDVVVQVWWEYL